MSDENLETYKRVLEAFNREGVEGVLPFIHEDVEIYDPDLPGGGTYRGHNGIRYVAGQLMSGFEKVQIRDFELRSAGDKVVALLHTYGRGEAGEIEVEMHDAHTVTIREGKIASWRLYLDRNEALADAGLHEGER
jgi:ketosteroid isomerase-like protein